MHNRFPLSIIINFYSSYVILRFLLLYAKELFFLLPDQKKEPKKNHSSFIIILKAGRALVHFFLSSKPDGLLLFGIAPKSKQKTLEKKQASCFFIAMLSDIALIFFSAFYNVLSLNYKNSISSLL